MKITDKKVIVLAHVFTTVPGDDLQKYLLDHSVEELLFIGHPLFYKKGKPGSHYRWYKRGKLVRAIQHYNYPISGIFAYVRDVFLTLFWVIRLGKKWDVMIALDNLNTCTGLVLRKLGYIDKVIYYTIDFVPKRFRNTTLNEIYHFIDKLAVKHADKTWNLTKRMTEGREKIRNLSSTIYNKQIIVPIGIWLDRIPKKIFRDHPLRTLVYAGGLSPHQGVQIVISALSEVVKKNPNVHLNIVGSGDYESNLKQLVKKLKLEKHVEFLGYQEKHEDVEKILVQGDIALAMYSKELSLWSYYADPSKIKTYLGCGLPVITTNVTYMGEELKKHGCGEIVPYDRYKLAEAILDLIRNKDKYKMYRRNAKKFAKEFDWNTIYTTALEASI